MGMLVGFHVEGWDHLILGAYLAKLAGIAEDEIEADCVESDGRGWQFVLDMLPKALHRFYAKCSRLAVIGVDNDGNLDIMSGDLPEDPRHPRHWIHAARKTENLDCRRCRLLRRVEETRPLLHWIAGKSGQDWPVVIAVSVEMIEAWLLTTQALLEPGRGSMYAEN
jgi:hypothetical protein